MIRYLGFILLLCAWAGSVFAEESSDAQPWSPTNVVFREPFTLKLHVDREHCFEQAYTNRIPYVLDGDVYLFSGEAFGIEVRIANAKIAGITYQPDLEKADVEFHFSRKETDGGEAMMLLVIKSRMKERLFLDALMTVPGRSKIYQTSILPVEPGLSGYESWPHPIVQLVLQNFHLEEKASGNAPSPGKE